MSYARIPRSHSPRAQVVSLQVQMVGLPVEGQVLWGQALRAAGHRVELVQPQDVTVEFGLPDGVDVRVCVDPSSLPEAEAAKIRAQIADASVPVILVTASPAALEVALQLGSADAVVGTCSPEELLARVQRAHRQRDAWKRMAAAAAVDSRFGLWTRHHAEMRLEEHVSIGNRQGRAFSCLAVHMDVFAVQDAKPEHRPELLEACVERLRHAVRGADLVFSFEAQQFLVLAPDCTGPQALRFANRLRRVLADQPYTLRDAAGVQIFEARVCIGISTWSPRTTGAEMLYRAGKAMRTAVRGGRSRVCGDVVIQPRRKEVPPQREQSSGAETVRPTERRRRAADRESASGPR